MPTLIVNVVGFVIKHFWKFLSAWFFILLMHSDNQLAKVRQEYQDHIKTTEFAIKDMNLKWQVKLNTAEKDFNEKIAQLNTDKSVLTERADSLSKQLSKAQHKWATAPPEAKSEYTNSLSDVFKECVSEYRDLAIKADGHALDAKRLSDAWPEPQKPP